MKIIVMMATALMAFVSFGGQQNQAACAVTNNMQATDAIVRYSLEVHRAIANRIMRERRDREERLRREIEIAERGRKASEEPVKKPFKGNFRKNPLNCRQTPAEAKQKKED